MTRRITHLNSLILAASAALVLVAFTSSAWGEGWDSLSPAQKYRGSVERARPVLAPHRTELDLIAFTGDLSDHCVGAPGGLEICSWWLSKQNKGWRPLAQALGTGDRLNLICALPVDETPRAEDSCSVHSQRSNRGYLHARLETKKGSGRPKVYNTAAGPKLVAQARKLLAASRTALELSTLVGDAPTSCRIKKTRSYCNWLAHNGTYGHGTLAMIAMRTETDFSDKIRLTCMLPADGSPRAEGSCRAKSWHD